MLHRTNRGTPAAALAGACCFAGLTLAGTNSASAQRLHVSADAFLASYPLEFTYESPHWFVVRSESYQPLPSRLYYLGSAALDFAQNNNGSFPALASTLFAEGYVEDPATFYGSGDVDGSPTTIDNDLPNAPNSAQISFLYTGDTATPDRSTDILFADNTAANNAGLGRGVVYANGRTAFLPVWPHPFTDVHVLMNENSSTHYLESVYGPGGPYSLELPADAFAESVVAPHRYLLSTSGSLTDEIIQVFKAEGFDDINRYSSLARSTLILQSAQLNGPPGPAQPVTLYARISTIMSRSRLDPNEFTTAEVRLRRSSDDVDPIARATVRRSSEGIEVIGNAVMLSQRLIAPGSPQHLPGLDTVEVEAVAQLTVDVPVAEAGGLLFYCTSSFVHYFSIDSVLGGFLSNETQVDLPVTSSVDQVKLYMPPGYHLFVPDKWGPGDMIMSALRGDHDMDAQVDDADRVSFEGAYSRPLVSVNYTPVALPFLQTFDFDGDGDLDCVDHDALAASWTGVGSPAFFAACDLDADGDGIPNGDDDCPSTPSDVVVDQRGCTKGDFDANFDVDRDDFASFLNCNPGPGRSPMPPPPIIIPQCQNAFDYDEDGDVDFVDFGRFQVVAGALND